MIGQGMLAGSLSYRLHVKCTYTDIHTTCGAWNWIKPKR
jgi:hypothetical protein